jgi:hypothetical protein
LKYHTKTTFFHPLKLQFEIIGINAVPQYVVTDENKLRQVLVNILGNAIKFTEQGGVTMRVAVEDAAAEGMRLKVEVADTGVGIAEDEMDKVFAYFEQTASGRAKRSGTGLGLALNRDLARMMGGDITVASKKGKGSTFYFYIDIKEGSESDISKLTSGPNNSGRKSTSAYLPRKSCGKVKSVTEAFSITLSKEFSKQRQAPTVNSSAPIRRMRAYWAMIHLSR